MKISPKILVLILVILLFSNYNNNTKADNLDLPDKFFLSKFDVVFKDINPSGIRLIEVSEEYALFIFSNPKNRTVYLFNIIEEKFLNFTLDTNTVEFALFNDYLIYWDNAKNNFSNNFNFTVLNIPNNKNIYEFNIELDYYWSDIVFINDQIIIPAITINQTSIFIYTLLNKSLRKMDIDIHFNQYLNGHWIAYNNYLFYVENAENYPNQSIWKINLMNGKSEKVYSTSSIISQVELIDNFLYIGEINDNIKQIELYKLNIVTNTINLNFTRKYLHIRIGIWEITKDHFLYSITESNNAKLYLYNFNTNKELLIAGFSDSISGMISNKILFIPSSLNHYKLNLQLNTDLDNIPDYMDYDDDNDGYNDTVEVIENTVIWNKSSIPLDFDSDLIPDSMDDDDDNDGHSDIEDKYPLDPSKWEKDGDNKGFIPSFDFITILLGFFIIIFYIKINKKKT